MPGWQMQLPKLPAAHDQVCKFDFFQLRTFGANQMHDPVLTSFLSEMCSNPNQWEAEWVSHAVFSPGVLCTSAGDQQTFLIPDRVWVTGWRKGSTEA